MDAKPYQRSEKPLRISILDQVGQAGIGSHKKFPFRENLEMLKVAQVEGFDEVLLINQLGVVGEGTTSTFIFLIEGKWVTPPLSSGVLPGIMRALAIENSLLIERELRREDLAEVQAMMALSSLRIASVVGGVRWSSFGFGGWSR
ncbi:MAG: aminotransferase class IV [Actinomycetota bacterium]